MKKVKFFFQKFLNLFKKNMVFFIGIILSSFIFLYSSSMIAVPFDNQVRDEITETITKNANESIYNLSVNSIELNPKGNSDYWIYTDTNLQNFQMRNQQYEGTRSYIFAAYKPYAGRSPFKYNNHDCSVILFESKFQENNFYFDLPLLYGSLPRTIDKNTIYITDIFATAIKGSNSFESLIGTKLTGDCFGQGHSEVSYSIGGIFNTNNNLGKVLLKTFGENLIFLPEYTIYQMNGSLYFIGSTNKTENKSISAFITNNYKASSSAARELEIGYSIKYNFYEYNAVSDSYELGAKNTSTNNIIEKYNNISSFIGILGVILYVSSFVLIITTALKNKNKVNCEGKGVALFTYWIITCVSLIINSILYAFCPLMSIIAKTTFIAKSTVSSTVIFLSWIFLVGFLSFVPFIKKTTSPIEKF